MQKDKPIKKMRTNSRMTQIKPEKNNGNKFEFATR